MFCQKVFTNVIAWAPEIKFESIQRIKKVCQQKSWKLRNRKVRRIQVGNFVYNATPDEIQEMAKPNFGTIFGFQLYTISSSSALHIAQYMYFLFLQLHARGTCIFLKSFKVPWQKDARQDRVLFLYLPPMIKKIQLKIWTKSKKIFCIVLRKGAIGHFRAGRVAMLLLWLLSALTVQPRILILHKLFKVK